MKELLSKLVAKEPLAAAEMERAVGLIMDGEATPAQVGAFLAALATRGETAEELVAAVRAMRARSVKVEVEGPIVDTCGTGGDGLGTFNISTATAFVVAAAGLKVAKHGNRAASGKVGAADVLEALGARIDSGPEQAARALREIGFAFLFAPRFHPAVRFVAGPRREVGFRTLFNLTGPLCNPAGATHQLLGLFDAKWLEPVATALGELGCERALVVHGDDGSDELTLTGPSRVAELRGGRVECYSIDPEDLGLTLCAADALRGGEAQENAALIRSVLSGTTGAATDVVALNAGAALYAAEQADSVREGLGQARALMQSGAALAKLDAFIDFSQAAGESE